MNLSALPESGQTPAQRAQGRLVLGFKRLGAATKIETLFQEGALTVALAEIGCGLALDDFGTGFASLTYLRVLPARYLKIDVEFVRDLTHNETNQHLVRSIIHLARGLDKKTIAEGVESDAVLALLRSFGVDYAQGFHLGRPEPVVAVPTNPQHRKSHNGLPH